MDAVNDKVVEVIANKLYWISDVQPPKGVPNALYFCVDNDLKYIPFFADFGPLNIAQVYRFVVELSKQVEAIAATEHRIYHYTDVSPTTRINAAVLMGCFMVSL